MPSKFVRALGKRLDARPDRLDLRDREFAPLVVSLPPRFPDDAAVRTLLPAYVRAGLILSQGNEGACTGFGLACVVNYLFWRKAYASGHKPVHKGKAKVEHVSTRMLYHLARFYDEWPGEDYDGSSCRGALKGWNKHGVCTESLWPYRDRGGSVRFIKPKPGWDIDALQRQLGVYYRVNKTSIVDMQAAIYQQGAIYVSSDVHDGWDVASNARSIKGHDALPVIEAITDPESLGGHAFALVGYNERGFVVQNSWDTTWGLDGFATLPYREWARYGSDAWVCAIGVPGSVVAETTVKARQPRVLLAQTAGITFTGAHKVARESVSAVVVPWTTDEAYRHSVVMDNDGRVISRIVTHEDAAAGVRDLVTTAPAAWLKRAGRAKRLVVYAHGGLNDEHGSIERIRVLAPYFAANDIYPLFLTWRTGAIETLSDIVNDELKRVPRPDGGVGDLFDRVKETVVDALDRTIEVATRPVVKPIWGQMKQNAAGSIEDDRGGALIAAALQQLKATVPEVEIHLVGHSAGSILLGYLLDLLRSTRIGVASCSLYAPACTVEFALAHYVPAVEVGVLPKGALHIHLLSNRRELDDTVGPYQKSLLYLVSRALESDHKTPILGLANVFDPTANADWHDRASPPALPRWQAFWGAANPNLHIVDTPQVSTGARGRQIKAAHGAFDNDAATIEATLARILGTTPRFPVESLDY